MAFMSFVPWFHSRGHPNFVLREVNFSTVISNQGMTVLRPKNERNLAGPSFALRRNGGIRSGPAARSRLNVANRQNRRCRPVVAVAKAIAHLTAKESSAGAVS
jgi:hypothetical protein